MDILLTHGYFLQDDPTELRVMKPYIPLGILSLAAYLERHGVRAEVFDSTFASRAEFSRILALERPPVVGIYVTLMTRAAALSMAAEAKGSGAAVVVGGPEPVSYAEEFLQRGADVVVAGEAEQTLLELVRALIEKPFHPEGIRGIVFRSSDGDAVRTPPRELMASLDDLPFPAREKADLARYQRTWRERHGFTSLSLNTMRGCPYTCRWCSHAVYGETYRRRSASRTAEEVAQILDRYAPDQLWFTDDVFTINYAWLRQLREEFSRRSIRIAYECITRADRLTEEVLTHLRDTGCRRLWIGSESGSQRILDAMDRRVTVEQVQAMSRLAQNLGISVGMFVMLGYAGETREDIEATVRHVRQARPDIVLTTTAYPIKGTPYYDEIRAAMQIPALDFSAWNDRMIRVTNRPSARYYWFAARRVVNEADVSRALHARNTSVMNALRSFVKAKVAQAGMYLVR
jgi:radical SAM superfamily enzyme YgiQ (UPF0313 family)